AIDISLLASLPSLSSSVAVPPVQSQPVGTGLAPVRTTTPLQQADFNPMSSANVQSPNVFAPSSSTFSPMPSTNMQPPNVFPSTGASPVPGGTSAFSPYANPHPMTTTSQQVASTALSTSLPSPQQVRAD